MLNDRQVLDRYFPEVRAWLIQVAAVMDRLDRAAANGGEVSGDDERLKQFRQSLEVLASEPGSADRAERIQKIFSDPVENAEKNE